MEMTKKGEECPKCGWTHGPHICVDLSKDPKPQEETPRMSQTKKDNIFNRPTPNAPRQRKRRRGADPSKWRARSSQTQWAANKARGEATRQAMASRDAAIISLYTSKSIGEQDVAKALGVAKSTVNKILSQAQERGELTKRRRGHTIQKGAK